MVNSSLPRGFWNKVGWVPAPRRVDPRAFATPIDVVADQYILDAYGWSPPPFRNVRTGD